MKKLISATVVAMLFVAGLSGCAQGPMNNERMPMKDGMSMGTAMGMKMDMKMMDMNGDGMISKEEFMKYHESMFDKMKKDSNGMVSMKDMHMMMDGMMKK